jgi:hypothetical protein
MPIMAGRRILIRCVTLQAHAITGNAKFSGMRLSAITAGDTGGKHLALPK